MSAPRPRLGAALFVILLLAGAALRFGSASARWNDGPDDGDAAEYADMARSLDKHGFFSLEGRVPTAYRAPLFPSWISLWTPENGATGPVRAAGAALGTICMLLVFLLGRRVSSDAGGLAAMALYAFSRSQIEAAASLRVETFFGAWVLCAALAAAAWALRPDARRTAALGLAIGASLLCRSTLFLLPVVLALWSLRRAAGVKGLKTAALLLVSSYVLLVPWTLRNAAKFGEFVPFERHASFGNLYAASIGRIETMRDHKIAEDAGLLPWSIDRNVELREIVLRNLRERPFRWIATGVPRVGYLLAHLFFMLFGVGLFLLVREALRSWREPAFGAALGLLAYFLAIHAPIAVLWRYLLPVFGVACALAGAGAARELERRGIRLEAGPAAARAGEAALAAAAALGAVLCSLLVLALARGA